MAYHRYTPEDDAIIRKHYRCLPAWHIAMMLGVSPCSVYHRAERLELNVLRDEPRKNSPS